MKQKIKNNKTNIIIFIFWIIISLIILSFHEPWRDEAQAWLIAKNLNIFQIFLQLRYEGHFILWYLIIMPFAKLGLPYLTLRLVSFAITGISVWLLITKFSFKTYQKIFIVFSLPLLYLYPAVSRCYCLIPLTIILTALSYKKRQQKPFLYTMSIVLLYNTHIIMAPLSGLLLLDFCVESFKNRKQQRKAINKKTLISILLAFILIILSSIPIIIAFFLNTQVDASNRIIYLNIYYILMLIFMILMIGSLLILNFKKKMSSIWKTILIIISSISLTALITYFILDFFYNTILLIIGGLSILFLTIYCIKKYTKSSLYFSLVMSWQILIHMFVVVSYDSRTFSLMFVLIFFVLIESYNKNIVSGKFENILFTILYMTLLPYSIYTIELDIVCDYSAAYEVGEYINENIKDNSIIIVMDNVAYMSAVIPYINENIKFYNYLSNEYYTFVSWDSDYQLVLSDDFNLMDLKKIFAYEDVDLYLLCTKYIDTSIINLGELEDNGIIEGLLTTKNSYYSLEDFILYKINF